MAKIFSYFRVLTEILRGGQWLSVMTVQCRHSNSSFQRGRKQYRIRSNTGNTNQKIPFIKRLQLRSCSNPRFQSHLLTLISLLLLNNFVFLWSMECFTDRNNFSAVAIQLNEISNVEILSFSTISTRVALWIRARCLIVHHTIKSLHTKYFYIFH